MWHIVAYIIFWILCCPILLLKPEKYESVSFEPCNSLTSMQIPYSRHGLFHHRDRRRNHHLHLGAREARWTGSFVQQPRSGVRRWSSARFSSGVDCCSSDCQPHRRLVWRGTAISISLARVVVLTLFNYPATRSSIKVVSACPQWPPRIADAAYRFLPIRRPPGRPDVGPALRHPALPLWFQRARYIRDVVRERFLPG